LLLNAWAWTPTDKKNPAIKQYLSELAAAHQAHSATDVSMVGVTAWGELHVVADQLKAKHLAATAANVVTALQSPGIPALTSKYGIAPVDFTKPAFPSDPALSQLRIFSRTDFLFKVDSHGVPQPLAKGPVDILQPVKIK
jgi:hypothetical protein